MKIAIVNWLINDCGGIISYGENLQVGLRMNGHTVQFFYATHQTRLNCDPDIKVRRNKRYDLLPSYHLSYRAEHVKNSIEILNTFDLIIFLHPSPHPTKSNIESPFGDYWKYLYTETTPKNIVIFHDRKWQDNNQWFADVNEYVDFIVAAQKHFISSVSKYPAKCPIIWEYFPLKIKDREFTLKEDYGIVCTQWIPGKNHKKTIPMLNEVQIKMKLFGNGMEYCNLKANGILNEQIRYDHVERKQCNENSIHEFYGFVEYETLLNFMSSAIFSIDWSTAGMTNMTHWEPLCCKTIGLMETRTFNDPHNMIPHDCVLEYSLDSYPEKINEIKRNGYEHYKNMLSRGKSFVQKCSEREVAKRILEKFNETL